MFISHTFVFLSSTILSCIFSSLSPLAQQHNESSVFVCVWRVSRAAAQRHTIFATPAPFVYFDTWGLVSRAAQRQQRHDAHSASHTYTDTHSALRSPRSRREQQLAIPLSYTLDRWHANAANAICKERVPLIRRPLSASSPLFLSHTILSLD